MKGSNRPVTALRYLIIQNAKTEEIRWYFGDNSSADHAELETEYQETNGDLWRAIGGGFYTTIRNDGKTVYLADNFVKKTIIYLFDQSGTFGLHTATLEEALPALKELLGPNYEIKDDYDFLRR